MELTEELYGMTFREGFPNIIAITGGGGKTTLLALYGRYLADRGLSVLITTSTKVQSPTFHDYTQDRTFLEESEALSAEPGKGMLDFYAERNWLDSKKVMAPRPEIISILGKRYDAVLYEADGSRGLPLKIHTERDPVIVEGTSATIGVMGAQGVGETVYEVTFGDGSDTKVDLAYMEEYLKDPDGMTKGMLPGNSNVILVNSYETIGDDKKAILDSVTWPCPVLFCSELRNEAYKRI